MHIDTTTYPKSTRYPLNYGYDLRPGNTPTSLIIHTTNGKKGTTFAAEASFLLTSPKVSSHYLVGKQGQVVQFLDPTTHRAWHAGKCTRGFANSYSIGIEAHCTPGETWTAQQHAALAELVRELMGRYRIAPQWVETHRRVALPAGRKSDPAAWSDADFSAWRDRLLELPHTPVWKVVVQRANIRSAPTTSSRVAAQYSRDQVVAVEHEVVGEVVAGSATWYKLQGGECYVWGGLVRQF